MSKNLEKKASNAMSTEMTDWGQDEQVSAKEIVIPKILLAQMMSANVIEGQASFGEMRDSTDNQLFGDFDKPFEAVPFMVNRFWIEYSVITSKSGQRKREFSAIVPIVTDSLNANYNDELPLVDGDLERDRCVEIFVMIPEEIKTMGDGALPYILSFRRTSLKSANKIITQMLIRNKAAGKSPAAVTMEISSTKRENDLGVFGVMDAKGSRPSTDEEVAACFKWHKVIRGAGVKVDHSDVTGEKEVTSTKEEF